MFLHLQQQATAVVTVHENKQNKTDATFSLTPTTKQSGSPLLTATVQTVAVAAQINHLTWAIFSTASHLRAKFTCYSTVPKGAAAGKKALAKPH